MLLCQSAIVDIFRHHLGHWPIGFRLFNLIEPFSEFILFNHDVLPYQLVEAFGVLLDLADSFDDLLFENVNSAAQLYLYLFYPTDLLKVMLKLRRHYGIAHVVGGALEYEVLQWLWLRRYDVVHLRCLMGSSSWYVEPYGIVLQSLQRFGWLLGLSRCIVVRVITCLVCILYCAFHLTAAHFVQGRALIEVRCAVN